MTLQELLEKRIQTLEGNVATCDPERRPMFEAMLTALEMLRSEAHANGAFLTGTFADPRLHDEPMKDVDGREVTVNHAAGFGKMGIHAWGRDDQPDAHIFIPTDQAERLIAQASASCMWDKGRYYFGEDGGLAVAS